MVLRESTNTIEPELGNHKKLKSEKKFQKILMINFLGF